jgi:hypothetical protein
VRFLVTGIDQEDLLNKGNLLDQRGQMVHVLADAVIPDVVIGLSDNGNSDAHCRDPCPFRRQATSKPKKSNSFRNRAAVLPRLSPCDAAYAESAARRQGLRKPIPRKSACIFLHVYRGAVWCVYVATASIACISLHAMPLGFDLPAI